MCLRLAVVFIALLGCGGPEAPHPETVPAEAGLEGLPPGPRELPALTTVSAMAPGGRRLGVPTKTREVCVVDLDVGEVVLRTSTGATDATSIAWSRDDSRLSTLGADGEVRVSWKRCQLDPSTSRARGREPG